MSHTPPTPQSASDRICVHKFGGTSLADSQCYRDAVKIILQHTGLILDKNENNAPVPAGAYASAWSLWHRQRAGAETLKGWHEWKHWRQMVVVSAMGDIKPQKNSIVTSPPPPPPSTLAPASDLTIPSHFTLHPIHGFDKVTNLLISCTQHAVAATVDSNGIPTWYPIWYELRYRHLATIYELLGQDTSRTCELATLITHDFDDLALILRGVTLGKRFPDEPELWWAGYGELWSARLIAAYINHVSHAADEKATTAVVMDARDIIVVEHKKTGSFPDMNATQPRFDAFMTRDDVQRASVIIVTGYIGRTQSGAPTVLGRDGSDYTASIVAALVRAKSLTIWKDVDGVYSANPGLVKNAIVREDLSYHESMELSYYGAKILHPKTMIPIVNHKIPVYIKNTFRPTDRGTCIRLHRPDQIQAGRDLSYGVRGFSTIDNLGVVNVEGTGMLEVQGLASRLFGALTAASCQIVMITQGGSQHSITFVLPMEAGPAAVKVVQREFREELAIGEIQTIDLVGPCSCLAVVGDGMASNPGVTGRFFGALATASINVKAIAQGSSERNISVIIDQKDAKRAVQVAHAAFLAVYPRISVALLINTPTSTLPSALIDILTSFRHTCTDVTWDIPIIVAGDRMLHITSDHDIDWNDAVAYDEHIWIQKITSCGYSHTMVIDATSKVQYDAYAHWMEQGIHIINVTGTSIECANKVERDIIHKLNKAQTSLYLTDSTLLESRLGIPLNYTLHSLQQHHHDIHTIHMILPTHAYHTTSSSREQLLYLLVSIARTLQHDVEWEDVIEREKSEDEYVKIRKESSTTSSPETSTSSSPIPSHHQWIGHITSTDVYVDDGTPPSPVTQDGCSVWIESERDGEVQTTVLQGNAKAQPAVADIIISIRSLLRTFLTHVHPTYTPEPSFPSNDAPTGISRSVSAASFLSVAPSPVHNVGNDHVPRGYGMF